MPFQSLDERIKNFITGRLKWIDLMPIQKNAIPTVKEGKDLLIISPTASGKTEAIFIPLFDDILKNNLEPLSILYVLPLKALINDIYDRMERWCEPLNLTITKWHGDAAPSKKEKFIKEPTDILLITPESLESFMINKNTDTKRRIFKNLRYVVIDEIHYFAASDRGIQLNSLLNRLKRYTEDEVQRIGLSATVGNPKTVLRWLTDDEDAKIVEDKSQILPQYKVIYGEDAAIIETLKRYSDKKILFFVHSRKDAERYHDMIRKHLNPKNVFIHHSSIDKKIKEESEENFKRAKNGIIICTSTLELGIDIGDADIIVQNHPPLQVSSFVQRVGRSGRRRNPPRSIVFCDDEKDVFITLAEICLANEEKLEEIGIPEKPKDIYFHQILSSVFEYGKIKKKDLFYLLNKSFVFSNIDKEEYKLLIADMIKKDFLEEYGGYLSLGYDFEKEFGKRNFMEFYSVFPSSYDFVVREGLKDIGRMDAFFVINYLERGADFALGGKNWKIVEINYDKFEIRVKRTRGGEAPHWYGTRGVMDYLVTRRIYNILSNDFDRDNLRYLDDASKMILGKFQEEALRVGFEKGVIPIEFDDNERRVFIYTFGGLRVNVLLSSIFKVYCGVYSIYDSPYFASFKFRGGFGIEDIRDITRNIEDILKDENLKVHIFEKANKLVKNKFIRYLPEGDQITLKSVLLFDECGLIDVLQENSLKLAASTPFKAW